MPVETKTTPESLNLDPNKVDYRQMCKYGKECYQKNPMHHQKFRHPKTDEVEAGKKRQLQGDVLQGQEVESSPMKAARLDFEDIDGAGASKPVEPEIPVPADEKDEEPEEATEILPNFEDWPKDPKENLKQKFLVTMPKDFYAFWDLCVFLNRSNPREAFLATAGLRLVGPFDLMPDSKVTFKTRKLNDYLCHWRYYYDPPEFQTILASEKSKFHIGYFRDDPLDEKPAFVASSTGEDCRLNMLGDNLFGALYNYLGQLVAKADPFKQAAIQKIKQQLHIHATMKNQDESFSLDVTTQPMKSREKLKVCSTFHGAGLVVPYNKKTEVGYRQIPETPANLKKIFAKVVDAENADQDKKDAAFDALQELVTNVQFANDEGDSGMGLELGLNAFLFGGSPLHSTVRHLLTTGYGLLNREPFAKIITAHLNRRKGPDDVFKAE